MEGGRNEVSKDCMYVEVLHMLKINVHEILVKLIKITVSRKPKTIKKAFILRTCEKRGTKQKTYS